MTSKLTSEILDDETLAELIAFRRSRVEYCQKEGLPYQKALHDSMMLALEELQERRKVERDTEPYGFTDGDRRGMIYKPEHSDRLSEPVPVYRHAQPAPERAHKWSYGLVHPENCQCIECRSARINGVKP